MVFSPPPSIASGLCLALCLCATDTIHSQTPPELLDLQKTGETSLQLMFQDLGGTATGYEVQFSPDLDPESWWIPSTSLSDLGAGTWQADVTGVDADNGFFRVKLLGLGETIQAFIDPAEFEEIAEGSTATITVRFSEPYAGALRYRWAGTAAIGNPTGIVQVNGTSAVIQLTVVDNATVDELTYLSLALETAQDTGYVLDDGANGSSQFSLTVSDNDSFWTGTINANATDLELQIQVVNDAGSPTVQVVGSASSIFGEDGILYPADTATADDTSFEAVFTAIPAPANNPNEPGANTSIDIHLTSSSVSVNVIQGVATMTIDPGKAHLATTTSGTFTLARRPSAQSTAEIALIP